MKSRTDTEIFADLVALEPQLGEVLTDAKSFRKNFRKAKNDHPYCASRAWYFGYRHSPAFKSRLRSLVGWHARTRDERLTTSQAWDAAQNVLLAALSSKG